MFMPLQTRLVYDFESLSIDKVVDKVSERLAYNFSVEMETGTGKTYTYIRTIMELNNAMDGSSSSLSFRVLPYVKEYKMLRNHEISFSGM